MLYYTLVYYTVLEKIFENVLKFLEVFRICVA